MQKIAHNLINFYNKGYIRRDDDSWWGWSYNNCDNNYLIEDTVTYDEWKKFANEISKIGTKNFYRLYLESILNTKLYKALNDEME